ncbi:MAG: hypothetical protein M1836_005635 [Candelina mexicana]|nr:MAG: hypothetical protein M1836_005635 [Candelina mexicana]
MRNSTSLALTFLATIFLPAKAWIHVNAQNLDTSTYIPKATTYVEWHPSWNRCETWEGIWQHTPTRIDQMVFTKTDPHEDFNIIMYKDNACANEIGYIPNASDGATVALTVNGNNNPKSLKKHDPLAELGEQDVAYPDKAKVFTDMKGFIVNKGKCRGGDVWHESIQSGVLQGGPSCRCGKACS